MPNIRMARFDQKGFEINKLLFTIIKIQNNAVITNLSSLCNINYKRYHLSLLVIFSEVIDLCKTKKSIRFATISSDLLLTISLK